MADIYGAALIGLTIDLIPINQVENNIWGIVQSLIEAITGFFSELLNDYRQTMISGLVVFGLENVKTKEDWLRMADRIAEFLLDHIKEHGDFMRLFVSETNAIGSEFDDDFVRVRGDKAHPASQGFARAECLLDELAAAAYQ